MTLTKYEWNPFVHVSDVGLERLSLYFHMLSMVNSLNCRQSAILGPDSKMKWPSSMALKGQWSFSTENWVQNWVQKGTPSQGQNLSYGGHIGSDRKFYLSTPRPYHSSLLCPTWMKSIYSCLRSWSWKVMIMLPYVRYGPSSKLLPVGHLGLKFPNDVTSL